MRRLAHNQGFALVELLAASVIMIVVLGAVLSVIENFGVAAERNQRRTDALDQARSTIDGIAKELRNATGYQTSADTTSGTMLRAGPFDLVFKTVDPYGTSSSSNKYAVRSVRYCLNTSAGLLYRQWHADSTLPATACPDSSWATMVAASTVNNGTSRSVFTYDTSTLSNIGSVAIDLFIQTTRPPPPETQLYSGVYLRNQNRPPHAAFTATIEPNRHVQLNGSASQDPDAQLLTYAWQDGSTAIPQTGPVVDYVAPSTGVHTFTLTVTDPGGLTSITTQTVAVS